MHNGSDWSITVAWCHSRWSREIILLPHNSFLAMEEVETYNEACPWLHDKGSGQGKKVKGIEMFVIVYLLGQYESSKSDNWTFRTAENVRFDTTLSDCNHNVVCDITTIINLACTCLGFVSSSYSLPPSPPIMYQQGIWSLISSPNIIPQTLRPHGARCSPTALTAAVSIVTREEKAKMPLKDCTKQEKDDKPQWDW